MEGNERFGATESPMKVRNDVGHVRGVISPLRRTFPYLFRRPFTVMYPRERLKLSECYRGHIVLELDKCIGCGNCGRACPNGAIDYVLPDDVDPSDRRQAILKRRPAIDHGHCLMCGLCVEACPKQALHMSKNYGFSAPSRLHLISDPYELAGEEHDLRKKIHYLLQTSLMSKAVGREFESSMKKLEQEYQELRKKKFAGEITEDEFRRREDELIDEVIRTFDLVDEGVMEV